MSDISSPNNSPSSIGEPPQKKKRAPRKPKVKVQRSAPWHIALQPLILQNAILPLLRSLLQQTNPQSVSDLFNNFCSKCEAKVSRSVFNSWLKDLGITFHQTTTFSLPGTPPPSGPGNQDFLRTKREPNLPGNTNYQLDDTGGGVPPSSPDEPIEGVTFTNDVDGPTVIPPQFSMAQAAHNSNASLTPDGIPTDQFVITPRTAGFVG